MQQDLVTTGIKNCGTGTCGKNYQLMLKDVTSLSALNIKINKNKQPQIKLSPPTPKPVPNQLLLPQHPSGK